MASWGDKYPTCAQVPITVCATLRANQGLIILSKMKSLQHRALKTPCSRAYQRVVLLSVSWETKASFRSRKDLKSRRGGFLAGWKHSPAVHVLTAPVPTQPHQGMKIKGEKIQTNQKPTVCKTAEDKMFIAHCTMSSTSGLHST